MPQVLRRALPVALVIALAAGPTLAQGLLQHFNQLGLTQADFQMAGEAADRLRANPDRVPGDMEIWVNEATGAKGVVDLEDTYTDGDGRRCVLMRHLAQAPRMERPVAYQVRECLNPDGRWMLAG